MNVLSLSDEDDFGGQGIRLKQAFDRQPGWTFRSVTGSTSYIDYPPDAGWDQARALYQWADVIHSHNGIRPAWKIDSALSKPLVIHQHGIYFRQSPRKHLDEAQGRTTLVSTLDLTLPDPGIVWLPSPHDLDHLARIRTQHYQPGPRLRVGHAPTSRRKHTDAFLAAVSDLDVEVVLIEGQSWDECLRLKATCDVFYDQLLYGYGNNAIEAWGMGIPVVSGTIADERISPLMRERFSELPFLPATEDTLRAALGALVYDPDLRAEYGRRGHEHARGYHSADRVVAQLKDIYRRSLHGRHRKLRHHYAAQGAAGP